MFSALLVACLWGFSFKLKYRKPNVYVPSGSQQVTCLGFSGNRCYKTFYIFYGWGGGGKDSKVVCYNRKILR